MKSKEIYQSNNICKIDGCNNESLSLVDTCPIHTESSVIIEKLLNLKTKTQRGLTFYEIDIINITISDFIFDTLTINECTIESVVFQNCSFYLTTFFNCRFNNCKFINCKMDNSDLEELTIEDCCFDNFEFNESNMSSCWISEGTSFLNSKIQLCEIKNVNFYDCNLSKNVIINDSSLIQCSFNGSNIDNIILNKNYLIKTSFYDSSLRFSKFLDVTNDFETVGVPTLCDFYGAEFSNTLLPYDIYLKWNNFEYKSKKLFYSSALKKLCEEDQPNNLEELGICLNRLQEFSDINNEIKFLVNRTYKNYWEKFALQYANLHTAGKIIQSYSQLPDSIKETKLLLGSPNIVDNSKATIKIVLNIDKNNDYYGNGLSFNKVILLNADLLRLQELLNGKDLEIIELKRGSLEETIIGSTKSILSLSIVLFSVSKAIIHLYKEGVLIKKIKAETDKIKAEIEKIKGKDSQSIEKKKVNLPDPNGPLKYEEILEKEFGFKLDKNKLNYEECKRISNTLNNHFPIIKIEVNINERIASNKKYT